MVQACVIFRTDWSILKKMQDFGDASSAGDLEQFYFSTDGPAADYSLIALVVLVSLGVLTGDPTPDPLFGFQAAPALEVLRHRLYRSGTALAEIAARHGGVYATHIRSENLLVMEAVAEAITIGR